MKTKDFFSKSRYDGGPQWPLELSAVNEELWWEIKSILRAFVDNQAASVGQAQAIMQLMAMLHRELHDQPPFQMALQHACTAPRGEATWNQVLLYQDDDMFLKLVTYFADQATPIHDHPGMAMVNLVISGRLNIEYYCSGVALAQSPISRLRHTETHNYGVNEVSICFPWQENIQEVHSATARSIVLSAGLKRKKEQQNSWYLPISPRNTANFFAQRLTRHD